MKFISILFLMMTVFLVSCEDYLDLAPELDLTEAEVFENYQSIQGYLDVCYNGLDSHAQWEAQKFDRNHTSAMSDEASSTYSAADIVSTINKGDWLNKSGIAEVGWSNDEVGNLKGRVIANSFYGIRIANKVLANVPDIENLTEQEKKELMGQAYFLRSWYYFEIIRRWGGMFILDKAYNSDDILDLPRLTYSESTEWLKEGLDKAIELLPDNWDAANKGRADKIAAMAVKEMAALYAASPLMQNDIKSTIRKD